MISTIFNKKIEFLRLNSCFIARLITNDNNRYYNIIRPYTPLYFDFYTLDYILAYNNVDKYKNMFLQIFLFKE